MKRSKTFSVYKESEIPSFFSFVGLLQRYLRASQYLMNFCVFPEQQKSTAVLFDQGENRATCSVSSKVDVINWVLLPFNLVPPAPFLPQKPNLPL